MLAANADNEVLRQYDEDLDAAFEQAREQGDLTPLVQTVRRWWFEADARRDLEAQREFPTRVGTYWNEGPPPAEQRLALLGILLASVIRLVTLGFSARSIVAG